MKTREAFEQIRKRKNGLSLRVRLVMMVSAEIMVCVLISSVVESWLGSFLPIDSWLLLLLDLVGVCLLIGIGVTSVMSKYFFAPIFKLRSAMGTVADGDYTVRLDTESSSKEIQEVYSGFNLMAHELQSTEMLQSDFVSNVSHEFKTPINAIEGYSTLLQGCENLTADQQEYVDKILFNTKRLSTLVGNILLLSKIENQDIPSKQSNFRLDEQIRQALLSLEPAWTEKDILFDVDMDSISYTCNESLLNHVWTNLIGNAIKFSPCCSTVKLRLKRQEDHIVCEVEDQGPGLSEEAKKHLFDKFYQADSSHKQEGNGLGLTLVKRILAISGGDVSAENPEGGGCRFTVILPHKKK
jgi:signal transduction histidine kinase